MAVTAKSMSGRICMVTGANAGIGKATALGLAKMGGTVVMVCRSRERGEATLAEIKQESGNASVHLLLADLSSQDDIRRLAAAFNAKVPALHVLINNAGIIPRKRTVTGEGFETQFAVNHLAYFLLTHLLLDILKASAPARIVTVSSQVHHGASIDFDDLQSERAYRPTRVYASTKLANVLFTYELARRLEGTGVTANCLHPGSVATNLLADFLPTPLRFVTKIVGVSPEKGAQTPLYLATSPEVEEVTGKYFVNQKPAASSKPSYDRDLARRLWQVSEKLTGAQAMQNR
jgi:NAD(P)-dependent dehydrogenase (short-subunit alcohol dehydrogenase family)